MASTSLRLDRLVCIVITEPPFLKPKVQSMSNIPNSQFPDDADLPVAKNITSAKTSGLAVASLIFGLLSFILSCLTGVIGLVLGIIALVQIGKSQGIQTGKGLAIGGIVTSLIGMMLMPLLLLPAVQATREAARRVTSQNNMRQLGLSMLNYESAQMRLPSHDGPARQDSTVKVSWRVKILPYLGASNLYDLYDQTQPWDSETNLAVLSLMPDVYRCPNMNPVDAANGLTVYQVPCMDTTSHPELRPLAPIFESGTRGPKFGSISDGAAKTILLLEVDLDQAVPWTKPEDWEFDPNDPLRGLGQLRRGGFNAAYADVLVEFVPNDDPELIKAKFTCRAGD